MSACTRANSEFVGGNGGSAGTGGGGAAGSGGGGAAGSGGGGGTSVMDLAVSAPHDMAHPPDMATLDGVACGDKSCTNGDDCCVNNQGPMCTDQNSCTGGQHPTLWDCDGPEDCPGAIPGTHAECCATMLGSTCDDSCSQASAGAVPMCHSLGDCPGLSGYVACCVVKALPQYSTCSKVACP
ncbi:MAG TPA: hypothetical protein VGL86_02315 [Polyangia bacterium]